MENNLILIFVAIMGLLSSVICFVLGQRFERHKQTMIIKTNLLLPIEEWLNGAERMSSMFGDTVNTIEAGIPIPMIYNFEERRTLYQKMSEGTNKVLGILESEGLLTGKNRKQVEKLSENIGEISHLLQRVILPLENEITRLSTTEKLSADQKTRVVAVSQNIGVLLFASHSIIAKLKTQYT